MISFDKFSITVVNNVLSGYFRQPCMHVNRRYAEIGGVISLQRATGWRRLNLRNFNYRKKADKGVGLKLSIDMTSLRTVSFFKKL